MFCQGLCRKFETSGANLLQRQHKSFQRISCLEYGYKFRSRYKAHGILGLAIISFDEGLLLFRAGALAVKPNKPGFHWVIGHVSLWLSRPDILQ